MIERDPHEVGQETANWTTQLLATYLSKHTGIRVSQETVRLYLYAHDYVCKCPTWTLRCKAEAKADLANLLALLPRADVYLQDEILFAFHPTLTRVWSRKGRRGQRLVETPGDNRKVYGFGLVDWREQAHWGGSYTAAGIDELRAMFSANSAGSSA